MADNKQAYTRSEIVQVYAGTPALFRGEEALIRKYAGQLTSASFLDIGIGGGRTTHFMAPLVQKYCGVDYSSAFVTMAADKYKSYANVSISFGDARNLLQFADGLFDFVLFSFNGIDCVDYEGRQKILHEVFRLLKPGGHFWFSFHNIYSLPKLYSFQMPKNPLHWLPEWRRKNNVKKFNGPMEQYQNKAFCILRDGADFFETEVLYIQPAVQRANLEEAGFKDIQFYHAQKGTALSQQAATASAIDWIYVDCVKPQL